MCINGKLCKEGQFIDMMKYMSHPRVFKKCFNREGGWRHSPADQPVEYLTFTIPSYQIQIQQMADRANLRAFF